MNRFLDTIDRRVVIADGALGTQFYAQGIPFSRCYDSLNLTDPVAVERIHRSYVAVGAELIETNTFGANRARLAQFGLSHRVQEINRRGVEIARWVAGADRFVAGSMSSLGKPLEPIGKISIPQAIEIFREQAEALIEGGVDLILLETFTTLQEALLALEGAKLAAAPKNIPVWVQMSFTDEGKTLVGDKPEEVARRLTEAGADGVGSNCSMGPQILLEVMERMARVPGIRLSCLPNAGLPQVLEGRYVYLTSPAYMAEYADRFRALGVSLIGGCCGTTPEHIKEIVLTVGGKTIERQSIGEIIHLTDIDREPEHLVETVSEQRTFMEQLRSDRFYVSVEIDPPRGVNSDKLVQGARLCKAGGVDCINVADSPLARARMSPLALSHIIRDNVGIEIILHMSCRDRNVLATQAELMGAHALQIRNILAVTGDPPTLGDYPDAKGVFELDSVSLTKLMTALNHGMDLSGRKLDSPCDYAIGVAINPTAPDLGAELEKYVRKVEAGAMFAMTQPVYELDALENFFAKYTGKKLPVMVGVLPLRNTKHAEFIHHEVPGMTVPQRIRDRMYQAGEAGPNMGVQIAQEFLREAKTMCEGVYLMPPFNKFEMAVDIIQVL
ncbi:MAG: bifunctional homocysteine S-methyltransferase/methylenetetrahydrofolate reductase [bacterium]|nr:bifunctional homocysteine S-methyltransferase/methylenetetrahydrofolate reductase [bacterium]